MSQDETNVLEPVLVFGIDPPLLIRKLNSKSAWEGVPNQNSRDRAEHCFANSFREDSDGVSVFRIANKDELAAVAVGLNHTPPRSHRSRSEFAAFSVSDVREEDLVQDSGTTGCHLADRLHLNLTAPREQIVQLIQNYMDQDHGYGRLSRGNMNVAIRRLQAMRCAVFPNANVCECQPGLRRIVRKAIQSFREFIAARFKSLVGNTGEDKS